MAVREVDDALMAILTGNAANAEAEGDDGRAKFLYKIAEAPPRKSQRGGTRDERRVFFCAKVMFSPPPRRGGRNTHPRGGS